MIDRFNVGRVRVTRIVEQVAPLLGLTEAFPDAADEDEARALGPLFYSSAARRLTIAIAGYVIESGGARIVVDTCVGDCKPRRRPEFDGRSHRWLAALAAAGFPPDTIDVVLCTHLHVDHVGGHARWADGRWQPSFPRARHLFVRADYEYWTSGAAGAPLARTGDYIADSVRPVVDAGLAEFVAADHRVDEQVRLLPCPGHSPGMAMVGIESDGAALVLAGDLIHSPLQLAHPDWSTRFCVDPDESRRSRLDWLARFAREGTPIMPAHFAPPAAIRIVRDAERRYRFEPVQRRG